MKNKKPTRKPEVVPYQVVCVGKRLWNVTREIKVLGKNKRYVKVVETPFEFIFDETLAGGFAHSLNKRLHAN